MKRLRMLIAVCTAAFLALGPDASYAQHDDPDMEWEDLAAEDTPETPAAATGGQLLHRIGGKMAIMGVVHEFVNRVMDDQRLSKHFVKADPKTWRMELTHQFVDASGGADFEGKDLKSAHEKLSSDEWNIVAEDLSGAMQRFRIGQAEQNELLIRLGLKEGDLSIYESSSSGNAASMSAPAEPAPVTLYDRLGGKRAIIGVVSDFVSRMMDDDKLNKIFSDQNLIRMKRQMIGQFSHAAGGPQFFGKNLKASYEDMGLSDKDMTSVIENLNHTLDWFEVEDSDKTALLTALELM